MLIDDLRFGIRVLRHSPGFAAVAILSLALGIGANTAIFSILNALILRPLPVREPDRLVQLLPADRTTWSHPHWEQLRGHRELFDGVFAWSSREFDLAPAGQIDPANGLIVSANFFDALGVAPVLGRAFQPAEERRGVGPLRC